MSVLALAVEGAVSGPDATQLFHAHGDAVWRILRHFGVAPADLDDACQEVFLIAHRKRDTFDGSSTERTWLFGIARRTALATRRRSHRRFESPLEDAPEKSTDDDPAGAAQRRQDLQLAQEILNELDEDKRLVFVLYEIESLPMPEIAELVGCPLQTAYARLHRAREIFRERARRRRAGGRT